VKPPTRRVRSDRPSLDIPAETPVRTSSSSATERGVSPALVSWIRNCLVPTMVNQYAAERRAKADVAFERDGVPQSVQKQRGQ
jgi:hypothetical protein